MSAIKHLEILKSSDYFRETGWPCVIREMRQAPSNTFVSMHCHEFSELVIVMAGQVNHFHANNTDRLSKGDFFVIHPGKQHGYAELSPNTAVLNVLYHHTNPPAQIAVGDFPLMGAFFPEDLHSAHANTLGRIPAKHLADIGQLAGMIRQEEHSRHPLRHAICESMFASLLLYLARTPSNASVPGQAMPLKPETDFIAAHLGRKITIGELCSISGKSASTLHREFKRFLGKSPGDYIISLRINKAKSLLRTTSLTLGEIASRTGFCCQSHLSRTLNARERDGNGSEPQKLQRFRIAPAGI
jgi:AraC-like DNA-binding protein